MLFKDQLVVEGGSGEGAAATDVLTCDDVGDDDVCDDNVGDDDIDVDDDGDDPHKNRQCWYLNTLAPRFFSGNTKLNRQI